MVLNGQHLSQLAIAFAVGAIAFPNPTLAQLVPDATLPNDSEVSSDDRIHRIFGGTQAGSNLFHSFEAFSIPTGHGAFFDNSPEIQSIFTRVTGGSISEIDGFIRANGMANLFLLNPNGILFGPNARLDIGGSFVATTAGSVQFADGTEFAAAPGSSDSILTISAPLGLQLDSPEAGSIINAGNLTVGTGQNLTLFGGTIASSGQLAAPGGRVSVSTVPNARSSLSPLLAEAGRYPDLGLTVTEAGEVALLDSGWLVEAGDVAIASSAEIASVRAETATLQAANHLTLVESQLNTASNLNLVALDTVRVRDSVVRPFLAEAGGNLWVQGNRNIDILALNHPQTPFISSGSLSLVSDGIISGDAHFTSGGNFLILNLLGEPGNFVSFYDPVIEVGGNYTMGSYTGAALKIDADGDINFFGDITINRSDAAFAGAPPGSDEFLLGNFRALILRAGGDIDVAGRIDTNIGSGNAGPVILEAAGDISTNGIVTVAVNGRGGDIFLNAGGNILARQNNVSFVFRNGSGGDVKFVAQENIIFQDCPAFNGTKICIQNFGGDNAGDSGNITLMSQQGFIDSSSGLIGATSPNGNGGNIEITARGDILTSDILARGETLNSSNAGNINITSLDGSIDTRAGRVSARSDGGNGGDVRMSAAENIFIRGINTGAIGTSGNIEIESGEAIEISGGFLDASGFSSNSESGDITITGRSLLVTDSARLLSRVVGNRPGGDITVMASDFVRISGSPSLPDETSSGLFASSDGNGEPGQLRVETPELILEGRARILTAAFAGGNAGSLNINTDRLILRDGARISALTSDRGSGGSLIVNASEFVELVGTSADGELPSALVTGSLKTGEAGNLSIDTRRLSVRDGAIVATSTVEAGRGGDLSVRAESIELVGTSADGRIPSGLSTDTAGVDRAGDLTIETGRLTIEDGAAASASTLSSASGGNLSVRADSIQLGGTSPEGFLSGLYAQTFSSGQAGNLLVETDRLEMDDGARITVASGSTRELGIPPGLLNPLPEVAIDLPERATGNAGNLTIRADSIFLDDESSILARTDSTQGGNIFIEELNVSLTLTLEDESQISAQTNSGVGGTVSIRDSQAITLRDKSRISAEATGLGENSEMPPQAGSLEIWTDRLTVEDGSSLVVSSQGTGEAGNLTVLADEIELNRNAGIVAETQRGSGGNIRLLGSTARSIRRLQADRNSSISASTQTGSGGTVVIDATEIDLTNGSRIASQATLEDGTAGGITVEAESIVLERGSQITAENQNSSQGGSILLQGANSAPADILSAIERSSISTSTATGQGGTVKINAADVSVANQSNISSQATEDGGIAGDVTISAETIAVENHSQITAENQNSSQGGQITIEGLNSAPASILRTIDHSSISTSTATGEGGTVTIDAADVSVENHSNISSQATEDGGIAGDVRIAADTIALENHSGIDAENQAGSGGNINLQGLDANGLSILHLRHHSDVSASTASGDGGQVDVDAVDVSLNNHSNISSQATEDGGIAGDVRIAADTIALDRNSRINAENQNQRESQEPRGGNITLQGLDSDRLRTLNLDNHSQVSASTVDGIAGTVSVDATQVNLNRGSSLSSQANGEGDAGNLSIETEQLRLADSSVTVSNRESRPEERENFGNLTIVAESVTLDNSEVSAATIDGVGGQVQVDATDFVRLNENSSLSSQAAGDGNAGGLSISTPQLTLTDRSSAIVSSEGSGEAGDLTVLAETIALENHSQINAENQRGSGGNIILRGLDSDGLSTGLSTLHLRNHSGVSASTASGDSGRVEVNAVEVSLDNHSNISSQATQDDGQAGDVTIAAETIALENHSQINAENQNQQETQERSSGNISLRGLDSDDSGTGLSNGLSTLHLRNHSGVSASTASGDSGRVEVSAVEVSLDNHSNISSQATQDDGRAGDVTIAAETIALENHSQINAENQNQQESQERRGGNITLRGSDSNRLRTLNLDNHSQVSASTVDGIAGTVSVDATQVNLNRGSSLSSQASGTGDAGDLTISAESLTLDRGEVSTSTIDGVGGRVRVEVTDFVRLDNSSRLASQATGTGDAGNLSIHTQQLSLTDSSATVSNRESRPEERENFGNLTILAESLMMENAEVSASTLNGVGGTVRVEATDFVRLSDGSQLSAEVEGEGIGEAGSLLLTTGELGLDESQIVVNGGRGTAGNINVTVNSPLVPLFLDRSEIGAQTASGDGGNINLQLANDLRLGNESLISARAGSEDSGGDGGNITIEAIDGFILGFGNSDIIANAFEGNGGNIEITTQSILGLQFRDRLTPLNDITASSELGVDGTIETDTIEVDPSEGLSVVEEPTVPDVPEICFASGPSSEDGVQSGFTQTGRGGLPPSPGEALTPNALWEDWRWPGSLPQAGAIEPPNRGVENSIESEAIVPATDWRVNDRGELVLFAPSSSGGWWMPGGCLSSPAQSRREERAPHKILSEADSEIPVPGSRPERQSFDGFELVGSTVFDSPAFEEIFQPFAGKLLTLEELDELRMAMTQEYIEAGYVTSGVYIPPQTVEYGTLAFQAVESQLVEIEIEGADRLEGYVRSRLERLQDEPVNENSLKTALELLQLDPLVDRISADLATGIRPGTNALLVEVAEADSFSGQLNVDNGRSPSVGSFRRTAQLQEGNLFGWGDRLSLGYTNTEGSDQWDIRYTLPIDSSQGTLSFNYGHASSQVIEPPFDELDIDSASRTYELTWRQPLVRQPTEEFALGVSLARYESDTSVLGEPFPLSIGANEEGETRQTVLRFFQDWTQRSDREILSLRSQFSLGLNFLNSTTSDFDADSQFVAWRGQAQWLRRLGQNPDTLFLLRGDVQLANDSLLSFESFGLGGASTVRGYRQNALRTDSGMFASAELWLPVFKTRDRNFVVQLTPFLDAGMGWNSDELLAPENDTLVSAGLGLRLQLGNDFTARIQYGIPLVDNNSRDRTLQEEGLSFFFTSSPF